MFAPPNYPAPMYNPGGPGGDIFNPRARAAPRMPSKQTTSPIVNGTSVLGIRYNGGVAIVADTLGSYGSLARFKSLQRIISVGDNAMVGAGGEYSDFQELQQLLDDRTCADYERDDGHELSPRELYNYLGRILYNRRNKMNPFYNQLVVGGYTPGEGPFLGYVDLHGTTYEDNVIGTGYGAHIAIPLLRRVWRADMSAAEAEGVLRDAMRVLYYRDARSLNRFHIAHVSEATQGKVEISEPQSVDTNWDLEPAERKGQIVDATDSVHVIGEYQ